MGLWRLLGGEVNWERVAKMQNREQLNEILDAIIHAFGGGLSIDRSNDDDKNNVMWVLEKFGRNVPTTTKYPWLKQVDGLGNLRDAKYNQKDWDQAWEWYDAYKSGAILFLEYRIQIREKELEKDEGKFSLYKQEIEYYEIWKNSENKTKWNKRDKPSRTTHKLIKSYEKDIPTQRTEIAKLKAELEPLKKQEEQKNRLLDLQEQAAHYGVPTREIKEAIKDKIFDKSSVDVIVQKITKLIETEKHNNINNNDLTLENENLRLKKEILEMELKLKERK
ncbi:MULTISPECIES: hypothetical protein [unclassified Spiroplasma]|uniref:hypothetical protein n=1 Tax=unclassified Spiroplasma TaxID=2637901 RepID=UPI00313E398B